MAIEMSIKTCQSINTKILLIFEIKNSQVYWGQPLTIALRSKSFRVSGALGLIASMDIPIFSYDAQYLARPDIIEFVNGNIGFGFWMNKTVSFQQGEDFEVTIKTKNPVLYEDFIKQKIEQPAVPPQSATMEDAMDQNQYIKGSTFDVFPGESDTRYLFDYYLFDIDTDEIIETSALIVPGGSLEEATRNAIQKMQSKVAAKVSSTIKVHLNFIKTFCKPKKEEDTFQKMADAIARGVKDGLAK